MTESSNETFKLSAYHEQCLGEAIAHTSAGKLSGAPTYFTTSAHDLATIWGDKPILVTSYRHALLDQFSGVLQGDVLTKMVADNTSNVDMSHLVWESHPAGIGGLNLEVAGAETTVLEIQSNFTQWGNPHPVAAEALQRLVDISTWSNAGSEFMARLEDKVSGDRIHKIQNRFTDLESNFRAIIRDSLTSGLSLTRICLELETWLADRCGVSIKNAVPIVPFSSSAIGRKVAATLELIDDQLGLEKMFDLILDQGQNSLFAGGTKETIVRVGYSKNKSRLEISEQDPSNSKRSNKPKAIPSKEVLRMLKDGEIMGTGKPLAAALLLASTQVPVICYGNGHGEFSLVSNRLSFGHSSGLLQMTEDWKDIWPIIQVKTSNGLTTPWLTSLYLLLGDKLAEYRRKSLQSGSPIIIDEERLAI